MPSIWPGRMRQRALAGGWVGGMEGDSRGVPRFPPVHYETSWPLMQMRWWGQREKNNMKGKNGHKGGMGGEKAS